MRRRNIMNRCETCSNRQICGKTNANGCNHYDISFTRSEVLDMLRKVDAKRKNLILRAIENVYKIKLAY